MIYICLYVCTNRHRKEIANRLFFFFRLGGFTRDIKQLPNLREQQQKKILEIFLGGGDGVDEE